MTCGFIRTEHDKGEIKPYIADLLTLGGISLFLPVSFIFASDSVTAEHKTAGYVPLSMIEELSAAEGVGLLRALVQGMADAGRHYIYDKDYKIDPGKIYTNCHRSAVKLCFIPAHNENGKPDGEKFIIFSRFAAERMSEEGAGYMRKAEEFVERYKPGSNRLLRYINSLAREIYLCGIK